MNNVPTALLFKRIFYEQSISSFIPSRFFQLNSNQNVFWKEVEYSTKERMKLNIKRYIRFGFLIGLVTLYIMGRVFHLFPYRMERRIVCEHQVICTMIKRTCIQEDFPFNSILQVLLVSWILPRRFSVPLNFSAPLKSFNHETLLTKPPQVTSALAIISSSFPSSQLLFFSSISAKYPKIKQPVRS